MLFQDFSADTISSCSLWGLCAFIIVFSHSDGYSTSSARNALWLIRQMFGITALLNDEM